LADHFSGWPHVVPFPDKNTSTRKIFDAIRSFFSFGAGAPVKFWSDGGPQFTSDEFNTFLRDWNISHGVSSAGYSQSNGFTEVSVKSMKKLICGSWTAGSFHIEEFSKGLLLYRNAPISGGASPAQLVFNRPVRDCLPAHRAHSLRSGKNRLLKWKKRPCAPARLVRPISTRQPTPYRRWRLVIRSSSKTA
jgi:transposase InsO family protein